MRHLWRVSLVALAILLALSLGAGALLGTRGGSQWLLGRIPGLQVEGFAGRLGGAWQADRLLWEQGARRIELSAVRFAWRPSCLLGLRLCLDRLASERVALRFPPGEAGAGGPLHLPTLRLPLGLELGAVQLGVLLYNDRELLREGRGAARWTTEGIRIETLELQRAGLSLALQGRVQPTGNWPLAASGRIALTGPDGQPWQLDLKTEGELQDSLQLQVDSSGYLAGHLEGSLQPLAEGLPARLRLTADDFKALASLPASLRLKQLELSAEGDLEAGYKVQGTSSFPAKGGAMPLTLAGRVSGQGVDLDTLEVSAGKRQRVALSGRFDWQQGMVGEAHLAWRDFPWTRLYPTASPPALTLRRLDGELSYQDGNYLGNFSAKLLGPAGPFSLSSPLSGDLQRVHLPQLQLEAGQGRAEGQLSLGFADGFEWNASLQLSDLDPAYWQAELAGDLDGPLHSRGAYRDGRLQLEAGVDLAGRLRGQPARLQLEAQGAERAWTLSHLDLRLGDNRVQGEGRLDEALDGRLTITMPRLGQLWPGLGGQVKGALALTGSRQAPVGRLTLEGRQLELGERSLASLTLAARLDESQRGSLQLNGRDLRIDALQLDELKAGGEGDSHRQRLSFELSGSQLQLALALDGRLEQVAAGWGWHGRLASGSLRSGGQDWRLQRPASLERLADGSLTLGTHCWRSGEATLCAEQAQRLLPEPRLDLRLRNFPLESLAPLWPEDFDWQGRVNGELSLAQGPHGRILLDAGDGKLRIRDQGTWQDFSYRQLLLDSELQPEQVDTRLTFSGERLGTLNLHARIDPRPGERPLSGEFTLRGFDLEVIRPFAGPVDELQGVVSGQGRLHGTLSKPGVDGQLQLRDGLIAGEGLPMRIEALQLQALIAGERLQLSGDWRSGKQGRGELDGSLDWRGVPDMSLSIRGNHLPVDVEPYASLEVDPDLRLRLLGKQLSLTGKVQVPRGRIRIRELPPDTVSLSEDAVVVGRETATRQSMAMRMDINVEVGRDKLTFEGFGLNAELAGHMHIGNDLDTRGELNLKNGRYRAYGQRLEIRRARLLFVGAINQPYLDIEAIRTVDDVTAGIRVGGNALQPSAEVFSEPTMSEEQALSYLILGRASVSSSGDNNTLAEAALSLGLAGASPLTGNLAERLGIKEFELGTSGSGSETSVVASGKLSDRLSLIYEMGVFESLTSIALRYQLTRSLYVEAAGGVASSLDLFYKHSF